MDNLFLTLRESIVENIDEKHMADAKKESTKNSKEDTQKKSHAKKKHHHHHKKGPKSSKLI